LIGVVTGLKSEIATLEAAWRGAGFAFFAAGGSTARAETAVRDMVSRGAKLLVSAGLAGGLDPGLEPGDAVLAEAVAAPDGRSYPADAALRERLAGALAAANLRWSGGVLLGSDRAVLGAADKAALHRRTRAACADMESHGVARVAAALEVPLVVLRVIADPAGRAIPASALAGMAPDGATRALPVLGRLLLRPWEVPAIARLARDSRRAHEALGRLAFAVRGVLVG
jgi:hopanoid-associated phosphorylase